MDEGSCTCQDNRVTSSEIAMTSGEPCDGEQMLFEPNRMCLRVSSTQISSELNFSRNHRAFDSIDDSSQIVISPAVFFKTL